VLVIEGILACLCRQPDTSVSGWRANACCPAPPGLRRP
jgi:hypothetical protein